MKKLSDFINKNRKLLAGIVAFVILLVFALEFYFCQGVKRSGEKFLEVASITDDAEIIYTTATLEPNNKIVQKLVLPKGEYEAIGVFMATYARENSGNINFSLECDKAQGNWTINAEKIRDNEYQCLAFENKVTLEKDTEAVLTVTSNTQLKEKSPTIYTVKKTDAQRNSGFSLTVNGENCEETICTKLYNGNYSFVKTQYLLILAFMLILGAVAFFITFCKKLSFEKVALIILIIGAFLYSVIIPPFCVPDEMVHYESAYTISNKMLFDFTSDRNGVSMRKDDCDFILSSSTDINIKTVAHHTENFTFFKQSNEKAVYPDTPVRNRLLAYLPSAIGITLGRITQLGAYPTFILARLINALTMCLILWLTMKIIPLGKVAVAMVGLLPMTLHLSGSVSYDPYTISMTLLMSAELIKLIYKKETLTTRDYIETLVICLLAIPYKIAYFTVPLIAVLIPKERFKTKKSQIIAVASFALIGLVGIVILQFPARLGNLTGATDNGRNTYTLSQLVKNPLYTVVLLFRTIIANGSWYYETMLGKWLGWLNTSIPEIFIFIFTVLLFVSFMKKEGEEKSLKPAQKWFVFLVTFVSAVVVALLLALDWTPATSSVILGVQGRYFTPLLLMVFLLFRNDTLVLKNDIDRELVFYALYFNFFVLLNIMLCMFTV